LYFSKFLLQIFLLSTNICSIEPEIFLLLAKQSTIWWVFPPFHQYHWLAWWQSNERSHWIHFHDFRFLWTIVYKDEWKECCDKDLFLVFPHDKMNTLQEIKVDWKVPFISKNNYPLRYIAQGEINQWGGKISLCFKSQTKYHPNDLFSIYSYIQN